LQHIATCLMFVGDHPKSPGWPRRRVSTARAVEVNSSTRRTPGGPAFVRYHTSAAWEIWWIESALEPDPSTWPAPSDWRRQLISRSGDALTTRMAAPLPRSRP
jgi:hypothetical protein